MTRSSSFLQIAVLVAGIVTVRDASVADSAPLVKVPPFKKLLYDRIGSSWYTKVQPQEEAIAVGTIRVALTLSAQGKILRLRVLSNTSNELFAKITLSAIRDTKIPAIPSNFLVHGKFQDEIQFTLYPRDPAKRPNQAMQPTAHRRYVLMSILVSNIQRSATCALKSRG